MDIMVAGSMDSIVMVEGEMSEVSEDEMVDAIEEAHAAIQKQCEAQIELAKKTGHYGVQREYSHENHDEDLRARVNDALVEKFYEAAKQGSTKEERKAKFSELKEAFMATLSEEEVARKGLHVAPVHRCSTEESRS